VKFMPYCPKCGNQVDENMLFCPRCGAALKAATAGAKAAPPPYQPQYRRRDEKAEKQEKGEKDEKNEPEKQEKGGYSFIGWLIGGLILIAIGVFSILNIYLDFSMRQGWAFFLLIIGIIIIVGAIYIATQARKRSPPPT
jgi:uncharacterized membrane protein YvbJ